MVSKEHITSKCKAHLVKGRWLPLALPSALSGNGEGISGSQFTWAEPQLSTPSEAGGAGQTHGIWVSSFELSVKSSFYEAVLC